MVLTLVDDFYTYLYLHCKGDTNNIIYCYTVSSCECNKVVSAF